MASSAQAWTRPVLVALPLALIVGTLAYLTGSERSGDDDHSSATSAPSSPPTVAQTGYSDCGYEEPVTEPQSMTMTCADGGITVSDIDWRIWEATMSLGSGTVTENDCTPSCADGTNIDYPATILMDQVESNGAGPQFTRAVIIFGDMTPNVGGDKVNVFDLYLYTN